MGGCKQEAEGIGGDIWAGGRGGNPQNGESEDGERGDAGGRENQELGMSQGCSLRGRGGGSRA
jgi:hypothetical protein